ncbi:GNAT family N-acetyltransferase [Gellertiella hungarica]|uniref:BioF2-like acetyltransferase domain-containing protein n=1 Tax=Gellertiella hungarica TaxID=1572859 RepID=A0A7W6NKT4_9HYPH|nr:GNAT family N-acetyltransferase [Gellertiella hungarica]MBB4065198.1 hypothetical protein [Gellertiella hungarica]
MPQFPPSSLNSPDSSANRILGGLAGVESSLPTPELQIQAAAPGLELCLYPARAGYHLQDEMDRLSNRAMEPNVFFTGRFLAPAMPRLEEKQVRLAILRDTSRNRSRARILLPYSIERPGFSIGAPIFRVWANHYGPLGTPLVDAEEAAHSIDTLMDVLARPECGLPSVMVLPDVRLGGNFVQLAKAVAISRNLPVAVTGSYMRPTLESYDDGPTYLRKTISSHHLHEMRRQRNHLSALGRLSYEVARQPADVRVRMEEFLALEARGWKGTKRTAMVLDRYRAAFAREAITNLAESDAVRIHTLDLNGRAVATMIVFIVSGEAYTWKTAYDEAYAKYSPGKLLMENLTEWHLDDANIVRTDSCAVPDHPIMARFWREREEMGTLVIGLRQNSDRDVRQVTAQLHLYRNTRNMARMLRQKILSLAGR